MFNEKIDLLIRRYVNKNKYSKLSFGIIINDNKYYFNYDSDGLTADFYDYEIGSISKTFTAHLVMKYVLKGLLKLDQQIGYYLKLDGNYPTIYELLTHTSGYRYITPFEFTLKNLLIYYKKNLYQNIKNDDVIKALIKRKKKKKYSYAYSDFNYAILAIILEKITNKSIVELLIEFIKVDLKMNNSHVLCYYTPNTEPVYKNKIIKRWKWTNNNPYICAGGICSNVYDMVEYMDLQLNSNLEYITNCHIVNDDTKKRKDNVLICPGWHAYKNGKHLWHVGRSGCYKSSVIISKNKNIAVVGLGNCHGKNKYNINYLVKMIYGYLSRNRKRI